MILIKIEMPKNCGECCLPCRGMCRIADLYGAERPSDCPLIEVPKHGRLIDADALKFAEALEACSIRVDGINRYIDAAPTIIEAEGE